MKEAHIVSENSRRLHMSLSRPRRAHCATDALGAN